MIGVITDPTEHEVVREFFELFKTPWEFYQPGRAYDVVVHATDEQFNGNEKLVIVYSRAKMRCDDKPAIWSDRPPLHNCTFSYLGHRIPIYCDATTFPEKQSFLVKDEESQQAAAYMEQRGESVRVRVGYDLFAEVRRLLTAGQPAANAAMPALDLHIALLRDFIVKCGIRLVEIPPIPEGHRFIVCLTHDVDHPCIRQHKWDHTSFGFFYRAVLGSLARLLSGRISIRGVFSNWLAALKLPFVYMGVTRDFWRDFDERYLQLENGLPSTFFLIPFKDHSGNHCDARAGKLRGARYRAAELPAAIDKLKGSGCEIGLHGIDAWCDSDQGRVELDEIRRLTGEREIGVRTHWLYCNEQSPEVLEKAGASYDSTVGYNETAGYRAGTMQVYKPLAAGHLLELPLHVMDTALFYPAYLGLSAREAKKVIDRMADHATEFGGCFTINWHDRSLAPERLWDAPYRELIQNLKDRGAWFATASQAVAWFKKRRSVILESGCAGQDEIKANIAVGSEKNLPGLQLRVYRSSDSAAKSSSGSPAGADIAFLDTAEAPLSCEVTP